MDWDDLRYVHAVRRSGSLGAAAKLLAVDKATVSRRVGALERHLGVRLFDRKPSGYALTPHGERVLAAANEIEQRVAGLETDLSEARGDVSGRVYLTVPQFFATELLLPALPAFRVAYPTVEIVLNASSAVLNVAQRHAEVGLRNMKPNQMSVTTKRVGVLGMALYASRGYVAKRGEPRTPADFAKHDVIAWDRAITFAHAFQWVNVSGARVAVRVNDAAVMRDAACASLGVSELPCLIGDARPDLVRLAHFGTSIDEIYAVAPGELRTSGRVRAVIGLLADVFAANKQRLRGR